MLTSPTKYYTTVKLWLTMWKRSSPQSHDMADSCFYFVILEKKQEAGQKLMLCCFSDWNFSQWSKGQDKRWLSNWDHMLLLLGLKTYLCTHKYTQFEECFQEDWMPGIPFVLACSHGCSWIWMCSCIKETWENKKAVPFTADKLCLCHAVNPNA